MNLIFEEIKKIDAHVHFNSASGIVASLAERFNFDFLTINTDVPFFPPMIEQQEIALRLRDQYPDRVAFISTFPVHNWEDKYWIQQTIHQIIEAQKKGAKGVKVWKNIGMELKDEHGFFVMIDHPKFDLICNFLEENNIPLLGHLGEPKNCWLPLEEMTVAQDRNYYQAHPEYHMYKHRDYPSYQAHIQARDNRCRRNPKLKFIGAHIGSLEWSINEISKRLDAFPLMQIDLAERICHLQYQAITNWEGVRQFCIDYQDRIIYGTDVIDSPGGDAEKITSNIIERWKMHWHFFTRNDQMTAPKVSGTFKGIALPANVIEKIYYQNAFERYYDRSEQRSQSREQR